MDVTSAQTATFGISAIARFAAVAVLATEALFLYSRRRGADSQGPSRVFWALTPALLVAGLCLWCTFSIPPR